jgi:hypothetical protein
MRKTFVPALVLALSALAGVGFAAAQGAEERPPVMEGGPMQGHWGFMHHHQPGAHLEGRLAYLKTELQIKPGQEKAWADFAAAAHQSVKIVQDARAGMHEGKGDKPDRKGDWTPPPVPARFDRAEKMLTTRLDALRAIEGPAKTLYAALDDTQKKTADEIFMGPMGIR